MRYFFLIQVFVTTQLLAGHVTAAIYSDAATSACCSLLAAALPNTTFPRDVSNSSVYRIESTHFWSSTEWLDPTCVFLPTSTADVETGVAIFYEHDCPFSVRGGGHSAIRGAANIDDGILVSMRHVRDITISEDRSSVVVGAGLTFGEIYTAIERENLIIVAGRFGTVGTGLLLGAGFSYFNNRYGLAVDNVKRQIVVLANGTTVNASSTENSELHWALKGGGNNFGVVTHFDLFTIESEGVFGGRITYPESSLAALEDATYNYHTKVAVEDLDVHVLPTYVYDSVTNTTFGATPVVANANVTELPTSLSEWQQIEHTNNTLQNTRYGTLANELVAGFPNGLVQSHYTFTIYANKQFFSDCLSMWRQFCLSFSYIEGFNGLKTVMPITQHAISEGIRRGGNALGLERAVGTNQTLSVFYLGITFTKQSDIEEVFPAWEIFIRTLQAKAKERELLFPYIMLTYSDHNQQVLQSYGEQNLQRMQRVQRAYDPTLVFQRLVTGGQKLPL